MPGSAEGELGVGGGAFTEDYILPLGVALSRAEAKNGKLMQRNIYLRLTHLFIVSLGLLGKEAIVDQETLVHLQKMLVHAFVLSPLLLYLFDSFFVSRMYTCDKWVVPIMVIVVILLCFVPEMSWLYIRFLVFCLGFWIVVYWFFRGIGWVIRILRSR
ncbi:MAG: hypothetical protein WCS85_02390 [Candidatus Peribacteraceae bacterium]|jgi:hypothetical protein